MKWNVFGEPRGMLMRQVQWRWTLWAAPWPLLWLPCVQSTAQRLERCPKGGMAAFPLHWDSCLWTFINTGLISKDTKESKCLAIVPGLLHRAFFVPKNNYNYLDSCKCILFAKGNIECCTSFNSANTVILMYSLSGLGNLSCNLLLLLVVIFDSWKNEIRFNFKKFFFII